MTPSNGADAEEGLPAGRRPRRRPGAQRREQAARLGFVTAVLGITLLLLMVIAVFLFGPLL
jgi:hypothetical protein